MKDFWHATVYLYIAFALGLIKALIFIYNNNYSEKKIVLPNHDRTISQSYKLTHIVLYLLTDAFATVAS